MYWRIECLREIGTERVAGRPLRHCPACGFDPELIPTARYEITLELPTPSQNQIGANGYGRFGYKYKKVRSAFARALYKVEVPEASGPRRLFIERQYAGKHRPYDRGNLVGGCKPILDCLVERRWLLDDSEKYLLDYYFQVRSDRDRTVLILEDLIHEAPSS